uniref:Uncharacterized protein n=1 Tax=Romanomermis culicivorax TaxID=13658 RepID=A0A915L3Q2_ROMCU
MRPGPSTRDVKKSNEEQASNWFKKWINYRSYEPSVSNFDSAEEHTAVGQVQSQVSETEQRQEGKAVEMSKVQEELVRISFKMAKQAEGEASVAKNVRGGRIMEKQRPTTLPRIIHLMEEMLDKIRSKWRPTLKSNLMDMNMDDYYKDVQVELMDD